MPEGLDEARAAFAQEIPQATRERDQAGRFVTTSSKPEPIFAPRDIEGDPLTGDTSDGGDDLRLVEHEQRVADGRGEDDPPTPKRPANDNEGEPPARTGEEPDGEKAVVEEPDTSPRYQIEVDGEPREVSLNEALRGYQREETFNHRMRQMVEVAKTIDERGAQAQQARDAYIGLCHRQEEEFAALIPQEPNWDQLYRADPAGAHQLENNYKAVYGTLNQIRQRRAAVQQEAFNDNARRTADYSRAEFNKFCQRNKLTNQAEVDKAIGYMRRTAMEAGFSEDEISTTYDERMLSVLNKAAKYDNMMRNRPLPVQPERGGALQPGSAPRIGNGAARGMNDAMKRLQSTGRVDDAASVFHQMLHPRR